MIRAIVQPRKNIPHRFSNRQPEREHVSKREKNVLPRRSQHFESANFQECTMNESNISNIDSVCGSVYRAFVFLDERDYHNGIRFSVGLKLAVAHSFSRKSHPKTSFCPIVSKCI